MSFKLKTQIESTDTFGQFAEEYSIGSNDIIVTNKYVIEPVMGKCPLPCDIMYQEEYGAGEPNDETIDKMLLKAGEKEYKRIIAVGGGSVIDISKLMVFKSGLSCAEIFEKGEKLEKEKELIAVPTTCGTGSEVTNISICEFKEKHTKKGIAIEQLFPDIAVLIPEMLNTLPHNVFAASSIDALIHSIESLVAPRADEYTRMFAKEAVKKILGGYIKLRDCNFDAEVRSLLTKDFLTASNFAGIAFGNTGVGAVHALSYPLGAVFHIPHGKANYLMLGGVFAHYIKKGADLSEVEEYISTVLKCDKSVVWERLTELLDCLLKREKLSELGMTENQIGEFAKSVEEQQQRLLKNNPVPFDTEDIKEIYAKLF